MIAANKHKSLQESESGALAIKKGLGCQVNKTICPVLAPTYCANKKLMKRLRTL